MNERVDFSDEFWSGFFATAAAAAVASKVDPPAEMMILGGGPNAIHEYSDTACCVIA